MDLGVLSPASYYIQMPKIKLEKFVLITSSWCFSHWLLAYLNVKNKTRNARILRSCLESFTFEMGIVTLIHVCDVMFVVRSEQPQPLGHERRKIDNSNRQLHDHRLLSLGTGTSIKNKVAGLS
jgi:hypothetical protein